MADVLSREGTLEKYLGPDIFRTHDIVVCEENGYVVPRMKTNYPGPHAGIRDNIADLRIESESGILAVKLSEYRRGLVLFDSAWATSEMFAQIPGLDYGRNPDGSFIKVQARRGIPVGQAEVDWADLKNGEYLITIRIPQEIFRRLGISGLLKFRWATAFCGNSKVKAEYTLIFPEGGWGPGGPAGYIPPTGSSVTGVPSYYAGICSPGGVSSGGGGGSPPEYPPPSFPPPPFPPPPYPPPPPPPPIPIPGTMMLLGSGLIGLFFWRRKA